MDSRQKEHPSLLLWFVRSVGSPLPPVVKASSSIHQWQTYTGYYIHIERVRLPSFCKSTISDDLLTVCISKCVWFWGLAIRCGLQVLCNAVSKSCTAGLPLREPGAVITVFLCLLKPGQNVAFEFSIYVITASIAHAVLHCCGQQIALNTCKCSLCLRAAEHYLFKMHGRQTAAIFKELLWQKKKKSNLQQISYLVVWE